MIEDLSTLPGLEHSPWVSRYVQGLIDVPFLNLTPGTRSGIIQDERYAALVEALKPLEAHVKGLIEEQQRAEEEQASQQSLKRFKRPSTRPCSRCRARNTIGSTCRAVRAQERREPGQRRRRRSAPAPTGRRCYRACPSPNPSDSPQRQFFDYAGPLFSVVVSPAASTTPLNETRKFRALPRDRSRRRVTEDLTFAWEI